MNSFHYHASTSTADALTFAAQDHGTFLAGGTTLIDLMKLGVERPTSLVDITPLPLTEISDDSGTLRIGAMVRNSDLAYNLLVRDRYPMLSEALLSGASAQLRNMATVGGNILQRTRCPYFRDPELPCNKRCPGSGCGAIGGVHRTMAILGTSEDCIATHASDMCVALAALDAVIVIEGAHGERRIPLTDFYLTPETSPPDHENLLEPGDLITRVEIPPLEFARRSHYLKVRDRASYEFALTSAAVALDLDDGRIRQARVALGGVGTKPWRSHEAEHVLQGAAADADTFRRAAEAALAGAKPHAHNAFKVPLAKATLIRALETTRDLP